MNAASPPLGSGREKSPGPLRRWLRGHRRALRESLFIPWQSPGNTSMTILTLAISFFLPLLLWALWMNVDRFKSSWHNQGSIAVFLKPTVNTQQAGLLMNELTESPEIASAAFVTPAEIHQQLQKDPQLETVLQLIKTHSLPTQLLLKPAENMPPQAIEQLIATQRLNPKVDYISYDPTWLRQLEAASGTLKALALASAVLFLIIVAVILGNTIGTHVANHRGEIRLLQLMGASPAQIRRRFLYGGIFYGALAAVLAWLSLLAVLLFLQRPVQELASSYGHAISLAGPDLSQTLRYFALALLVTWVATRLALQQQIREAV